MTLSATPSATAKPRLLVEGALNLVLGKLGKVGLGGSHFAASVAADFSVNRWPLTGEPRRPGRVIYLYADDRREFVVRRLETAGANMERVAEFSRLMCGLEELPELADGMGETTLVVLDPLSAFLVYEEDFAALDAVLSWAKANRAAILAMLPQDRNVPRRLLRMAGAVFLAIGENGRQSLAPISHPTIARPVGFSIEPPLVWEPLQAEAARETLWTAGEGEL